MGNIWKNRMFLNEIDRIDGSQYIATDRRASFKQNYQCKNFQFLWDYATFSYIVETVRVISVTREISSKDRIYVCMNIYIMHNTHIYTYVIVSWSQRRRWRVKIAASICRQTLVAEAPARLFKERKKSEVGEIEGLAPVKGRKSEIEAKRCD